MKILTLLAVTFLSACATEQASTMKADCVNPVAVQLVVHKKKLTMSNNDPICVTAPGEFKVKIKNPPGSGVSVGAGDATAGGKASSPTMEGSNTVNSDTLVVEIKESASIGDELHYWVHVNGVPQLDPTVRVIGNQQRTNLTYSFAAEALDLLGVDPALAKEMLRPIEPEQSK